MISLTDIAKYAFTVTIMLLICTLAAFFINYMQDADLFRLVDKAVLNAIFATILYKLWHGEFLFDSLFDSAKEKIAEIRS